MLFRSHVHSLHIYLCRCMHGSFGASAVKSLHSVILPMCRTELSQSGPLFLCPAVLDNNLDPADEPNLSSYPG